MSSRTWLHRPDLSPTSAADLACTRLHSRGAVTASTASTGHLAWSRNMFTGPRSGLVLTTEAPAPRAGWP